MLVDVFSIGPLTIRGYGLMLALGFFSGIVLAAHRAKKAGEDPENIYNLSIWIVLSSLLGARIYYILTHYHEFSEKQLAGFARYFSEFTNMFWPFSAGQVGISGLILYGGIIAATAATIIFLRNNRLSTLKYMDIIAPSLGLGEFFTRIGCFLNGCCFGNPTHLPIGVVFPENSAAGYVHPHQHLHPAQLYNSLAGLLIMFALLYLDKHKKFTGFTAIAYFMFYSVMRFSIDFFRDYESGMKVSGLSQNQILSMVVFIVSAVLLWFLSRRASRQNNIPDTAE